jgi:hypothetical protein
MVEKQTDPQSGESTMTTSHDSQALQTDDLVLVPLATTASPSFSLQE